MLIDRLTCLRLVVRTVGAVLMGSMLAISSAAQGPHVVSLGKPVKVMGTGAGGNSTGGFSTSGTDKAKPRGVSGLACIPSDQAATRCLAVNDEVRYAEWAELQGDTLKATGLTVQLISKGKDQKDVISGTPPSDICKEKDDFDEFDGEAVAISDGWAYVVGSHACSRKKGKFKPSSFVLARFKTSGIAAAPEVERTWRVSDLIRNSALKGHFGRPGEGGTNIEGLAIVEDNVFFGFRTPSQTAGPFILRASLKSVFDGGSGTSEAEPKLIELKLGVGVGIRDLAALPDGRLLVLSGPSMEGSAPYLLHVLSPDTGAIRTLVELRAGQPGKDEDGKDQLAKAEAIAVIGWKPSEVAILVLYDNINDGGPRMHTIDLRERLQKGR